MSILQTTKCPACGAAVIVNMMMNTGKCDYCDTTFEIEREVKETNKWDVKMKKIEKEMSPEYIDYQKTILEQQRKDQKIFLIVMAILWAVVIIGGFLGYID